MKMRCVNRVVATGTLLMNLLGVGGPAPVWAQTPEAPWASNIYGDYTQNVEITEGGYRFTPLVNGHITHLGGLFSEFCTCSVALYDDTWQVLASVDVTSYNYFEWATLPVPVNVTAGHTYAVVAYIPVSEYGLTAQLNLSPPLPRTFGNIRIEDSLGSTGEMYGQPDVVFVPGEDNTPPTAPGIPKLTAVGSQQINLFYWAASTPGSFGLSNYRVERCQGADCSNFGQIAIVTPPATRYRDTARTPGTLYVYRVRACDANDNCSPYSPNASAKTKAADTEAPTAPGAPILTVVFSNQIHLTWAFSTDSGGSGLADYRVERCTGSGCTNFSPITIVPGHKTGFNDTGLSTGTTYVYRVRARDEDNNYSTHSASAGATATTTETPWASHVSGDYGYGLPEGGGYRFTPLVEGHITGLGALLYGEYSSYCAFPVSLYDDATAQVLASAEVLSDGSFGWAPLPIPVKVTAGHTYGVAVGIPGGCEESGTDYVIDPPLPRTFGNIRIEDSNGSTTAMYGQADITFVPGADQMAPTAPGTPLLAVVDGNQIHLSWADSTDNGVAGVSDYRVERCAGIGCTGFMEIATVEGRPPTTRYSDTGLSASTAYAYRVRARDADDNYSPYSAPASATSEDAACYERAYQPTLYVTTSSAIMAFDPRDYTQVGYVPVEGIPGDLAANPDGKTVYVMVGADLTVVDVRKNLVVQELSEAGGQNNHVVVSPDGNKVYVASSSGGSTVTIRSFNVGLIYLDDPDGLVPLESRALAHLQTITGFNECIAPAGLGLSPDGTKLYLACHANDSMMSGRFYVVNTAANPIEVIHTATFSPYWNNNFSENAMAVHPSGNKVYVVRTVFGSPSTVEVFNGAGTHVDSILLPTEAWNCRPNDPESCQPTAGVVTPDGDKLYTVVPMYMTGTFVMNANTDSFETKLDGFTSHGIDIAISRDGTRIYTLPNLQTSCRSITDCLNNPGKVFVNDTSTDRWVSTMIGYIPVPSHIAIAE